LRAADRFDEERADAVPEVLGRLLRTLAAMETIFIDKPRGLEDELEKIGTSVNTHATREASRTTGLRIAAVDVFGTSPVAQHVKTWVADNVDRITTLSRGVFADIRKVVEAGAREGKTGKAVARDMQRRFNVGRSRARFIARDQIASLNGQITEARQTDLGITRYKWSTSGDERVRDTHTDLDGEVFSWDSPPVTNDAGDRNHPGGDYNCRCVAIPVLD
jgi:SPP1 gp7 family putative phage head morphogenesis protein